MTVSAPRELLNVLVGVDADSVTATFDLGEPFDLDVPADWFTYVLEVIAAASGQLRHFGVRISPTETKAFVFDFESGTQANYDASHVTDRGTSVVVRFTDASLHVDDVRSLKAVGTIEGEDVSVDVPAQIL